MPSSAESALRKRLVLFLFLVPLALIGPVLLAGELFLPQVPAHLAPFREEDPERAEAAREGQVFTQADRLYPVLTDQYAIRARLQAGELPTWEPLHGFGAPLVAESISGAAYPPNWLAFLFPPERAAGPLAMLSLFLAGLGMWLFLGRLGLTTGARAAGALAFQLGGFGVGNLYYYMKLDAALWLPWALWAVEGVLLGKRRSAAWLALSIACSLAAGMLAIGAFVCGVTALYALARCLGTPASAIRRPEVTSARIPPLAACVLFLALGVAGAAIAWLPMVEASGQSLRREAGAEVLRSQSLPLATALGVVVHDLVGEPTEGTPPGRLPVAGWLTPADEGPSAEQANQQEWNLYAGAIVCALAIVALVANTRRAALPFALLLVVLGFVQGWPLVSALYHVPGLNAGHPARALAIAWMLWPWLAALGVDAVVCSRPRALSALTASAASLLVLGLLFTLTTDPVEWARDLDETLLERGWFGDVEEIRELFSTQAAITAGRRLVHGYRVLAVAGGLMLLATLLVRQGKTRSLLRWTPLVIVVFVEGIVAAEGHASGRPVGDGIFPPSEGIEAIRRAARDGRVIRFDTSASGVEDVLELARPNMLQPYGVGDQAPWIVFPPQTFVELFESLDPPSRRGQGISRLSNVDLLTHPVLDLARTTCVLSRRALEHPRLVPELERTGFNVYHRTGALPPARVVPRVVPAASDEAGLRALVQGMIAFDEQAMIAPEHRSSVSAGSDGGATISSFERPTTSSIRVTLQDATGGWLVVHEQFYPGWRATRDGESVPVLRADHAYMAVPLAAGATEVLFEYAPGSFSLGVLLSLAGLLGALVAGHLLRT